MKIKWNAVMNLMRTPDDKNLYRLGNREVIFSIAGTWNGHEDGLNGTFPFPDKISAFSWLIHENEWKKKNENVDIYIRIKTKISNACSTDDLKDVTPLEMAKQIIADEGICGVCDLETAEITGAYAKVSK